MNGTFGEFVKRHSLPIGIGLMFLLTWPIDLAHAGYLQLQIPFVVYLFLGWGFVIAAIAMTAFTLGKSGVVALLKRFLIWRVGGAWLAVDAISNVRRSIYLALQQHPRQPVDDDVVPCFCKHGWSVPADCEHGGRRPRECVDHSGGIGGTCRSRGNAVYRRRPTFQNATQAGF